MLSLLSLRCPYTRFARRPFLVVDWGTTGVVLSEIRHQAGRPQVVRSEYLPWPSAVPETQPGPLVHENFSLQRVSPGTAKSGPDGHSCHASIEETGAWLAEICHRQKYPTDAVAISVPRRDLSLKLLELPNVCDDELGPLVALQVESRIQTTGQPVAWDCIPHPSKPGKPHRYVMLATIPISVHDRIRRVAQKAGWSHLVITSGDLLISNIAPTQKSDQQMHVQANRTKLEMQLAYRGLPVASYATAMPVDGPSGCDGMEAAAVIIRSMTGRLLAAVPGDWRSEGEPPPIFVAGLQCVPLLERLSSELEGVAEPTLTDERTPRAMAVALSLSGSPELNVTAHPDRAEGVSGRANRIDFLRPRSADGRKVQRQQRLMQFGLAVTLVISLAAVGLWARHRALLKELALLDSERQRMQQYVDRGEDVVEKWSYVSRWRKETLQAADEIRRVASLLPSRQKLIVTRLQLENVVGAEDSTLRMDGMAQSPEDVLQMNASLLGESRRYDLRPQGIEPAPVGSSFPSQFRIEAVLRRDAENSSAPLEGSTAEEAE